MVEKTDQVGVGERWVEVDEIVTPNRVLRVVPDMLRVVDVEKAKTVNRGGEKGCQVMRL